MRSTARIITLGACLTLGLQARGDDIALSTFQPTAGPAGVWRSRAGDDLAWADPEFDDSTWQTVPIPATWTEQGYDEHDGYIWYRCELPVHRMDGATSDSTKLGLLVGPTRHGSYELYADGKSIGRYGSESLRRPVPAARAYEIPPGAVNSQGRLALALRVWRVGWASARAERLGYEAGPAGTTIELGDYDLLRDRAALMRQRALKADVPRLMFAAMFALVALAYLQRFLHLRTRVEHFWFGITALLLAANTILVTAWPFELTDRIGLVHRLNNVVIHLAVAASIQFLWPFLSKEIGRLLRGYQWAHIAMACAVAAVLSPELVAATKGVRWAFLLPLLVAAPVLIIQRVRRGDREARTIGMGVLILVATEFHEWGTQVLHLAPITSIPLPSFGFAALVLTMAISVSNRHRRDYRELAELRRDLQRKVEHRTVALSAANDQLIAEVTDRTRAEAAMRDSDVRFRQIAENIEDVFWLTDWVRHKVLYVSPAYEQVWGCPRGELYGDMRSWAQYLHPEDKERVLDIANSGEARSRSDLEYRIVRRDGEIRWIHERAFTVCDEAGEIRRIAGISRDITQQKRAEEARRAAEERRYQSEVLLKGAQRVARMGFWDWNIREDELYWSDEIYRIFGLDAGEVTATNRVFVNSVHPDDRARVQANVDATLNDDADYAIDYRVVLPGGDIRYVYEQGEVTRDSDSRPIRMLGTVIDITERRQAEETARDLSRILDTYFDSTLTCLALLDRDFNFIRVNEAYARASQREVAEFVGRNHFELYPSDAEAIFKQVVETKEAFQVEARPFVYPDQPERGVTYWDWTLVPILDDGGEVELLIFSLVDVTEKKNLEDGLRHAHKLEAVGTLASGVAHDFNNVLTAIVGYNEVAKQIMHDDPMAAEALEGITMAADQATAVTRSLLAFSRKSASVKVPLDFRKVVGESVTMLRRMMPAAVEIVQDVDSGRRLFVEGEETQIQQVVINLAINARDAMADGGRLTISLEHRPGAPSGAFGTVTSGDHGAAVLIVEDTGIGMSKAVADRVFEPFFTTKSRERGTGLGMAVVHGIISDHFGRVEVESKEGHGTRVTIALPCCDSPASQEVRVPAEHVAYTGRGETILVAEDNRHVRGVVSQALAKSGFRVAAAADGEEAMELFRERLAELALVVVDIDLPKKTGTACLDEMRECRPGLPAVIITGSADFVLLEGMTDRTMLLRKPFPMSKLAAVVQDLLAVSR